MATKYEEISRQIMCINEKMKLKINKKTEKNSINKKIESYLQNI